jgi:hypothetical protein
MNKQCNNCGHKWQPAVYACPRCNSLDINYLNETKELPIGMDTYPLTNDLKSWYTKTLEAIKRYPKKD